MKNNFLSREQLDLLPQRIRKAEETDATRELYSYIGSLWKPHMDIMIVGAGGSYPSAIFAKHVLHEEMRTPFIEAVTPQTAIRIITEYDDIIDDIVEYKAPRRYTLVIGISYSGRTPDIKAVSDVCMKKGYPFLLLTGAEKSELSDFYTESNLLKIISYYSDSDATGKEKSMISLVSTLAPITIFYDDTVCKFILENQNALLKGNLFVSKLNITEIATTLKEKPVIHVFYEWDTLPTAADIESKFTESGIAHVILHEKKDFSHGRCTSLCRQDFGLVINLVRYNIKKWYKTDYDLHLSNYLKNTCEKKSANYLEIGTKAVTTTKWNIETLAIIPYLVTAIGEELDIDISKHFKPFPKEAIYLYDYKGVL